MRLSRLLDTQPSQHGYAGWIGLGRKLRRSVSFQLLYRHIHIFDSVAKLFFLPICEKVSNVYPCLHHLGIDSLVPKCATSISYYLRDGRLM
jgi:hypothetical protein